MLRSLFKYAWIPAYLITAFSTLSSAQNIKTVAGDGTYDYSGEGLPAILSENEGISGIAVDSYGNYYLADPNNHTVSKVNTAGIITRFAGDGTLTPGFSGDGDLAIHALLNYPTGVASDALGNVYITDRENHRIRKVSVSGTISTIAGNGFPGFFGEGVPATAAEMASPGDLFIDVAGNIYFSDNGNSRVRKINAAGIITTIAGDGTVGMGLEGVPATSTPVREVAGVCADAAGNVYIAEVYYNRIRKISPAGIITTVAGTGTAGYSGDGTPATAARLNNPACVRLNPSGELLISDVQNHRIRKVDAAGIISTVAGTGTAGFFGDGGPATAAQFKWPSALAINSFGELLISDEGNARVRQIFMHPVAAISATSLDVCEDSCIIVTNTSVGTPDSIRWSALGTPLSTTMTAVPICFATFGTFDISLYVYNVSGTDTATISVTVNEAPSPVISYSGGVFTTATGFASYQWYKDGAAIAGATNYTYTSTGPGSYMVKVTSTAGGCHGLSPAHEVLAVTSVDRADISLLAIPNPNNGVFTIKGIVSGAIGDHVSIKITNMLGQAVHEVNVPIINGLVDAQMDLKHLPGGVYLLQAGNGIDMKSVSRIVIER